MMVNRRRGEVAIILDGKPYRLLLTLGALAELESAFAVEDLQALGARFSSGRLSSVDLGRILVAGLRGAGHDIDAETVASMQPDGGLPALVQAIGDLLRITFVGSDEETPTAVASTPGASLENP